MIAIKMIGVVVCICVITILTIFITIGLSSKINRLSEQTDTTPYHPIKTNDFTKTIGKSTHSRWSFSGFDTIYFNGYLCIYDTINFIFVPVAKIEKVTYLKQK